MTGDANLNEEQRRVDATIQRARASHMSDTKWRKLFHLFCDLRVGLIRWKFIRDERVFEAHSASRIASLEHCLGDVLPSPYGPYREIEWIEIPDDQAHEVEKVLSEIGHFPLVRTESGLRIIGYTW